MRSARLHPAAGRFIFAPSACAFWRRRTRWRRSPLERARGAPGIRWRQSPLNHACAAPPCVRCRRAPRRPVASSEKEKLPDLDPPCAPLVATNPPEPGPRGTSLRPVAASSEDGGILPRVPKARSLTGAGELGKSGRFVNEGAFSDKTPDYSELFLDFSSEKRPFLAFFSEKSWVLTRGSSE